MKKRKLAKALSKLSIDNVKKLTEYYDDDDCKRCVEKRSSDNVQTEKMDAYQTMMMTKLVLTVGTLLLLKLRKTSWKNGKVQPKIATAIFQL